MLNIASSVRPLMYSRKSVGPRMDPCGTPALTGYSCKISHPEPPEAAYY